MKRSALHWTVAMGCFLVSAVVACAAETPADATADDTISGTGPGGTGVGSKSDAPGGLETTATGLPCDVDEVLKSRCQTCHASDRATARAFRSSPTTTCRSPPPAPAARRSTSSLAGRIHDDARPMPPSPQPAAHRGGDRRRSTSWIAAGAKPSTDTCTNATAERRREAALLHARHDAQGAAKYTMPQGHASTSTCASAIDINLPTKRHITALAPRVDNKTILHHILLFQSPKAESTSPRRARRSARRRGSSSRAGRPAETTSSCRPRPASPRRRARRTGWCSSTTTTRRTSRGQDDNSGYELCTTETLRPNDAGVLAFGSTNFTIPPRSTTTVNCDYTLPASFTDVKLFNASPHMHTRGAAMSTERLAGGTGAPEIDLRQPNFTFENQANFPIKAEVAPGDVMRTRCTWKNPGDTTIAFGENTGDEMCFDFIGYYPNIPDKTIFGLPLFTWVTPSQSATCTTE